MTAKWKYKLWKHLTKRLAKEVSLRDKLTDVLAASMCRVPESGSTDDVSTSPQIICVQGYTYTGSSAVIGFLNEFDNTLVVGNPEAQWSRSLVSAPTSECRFFTHSGFMELLEAYHSKNPCRQDVALKQFAYAVERAYQQKKFWEWEYLPELYGKTFRKLTHDLLMEIIEMDDTTKQLMQEKPFPHALSDHCYDHCSFVQGNGTGRQIFYRFRMMEDHEFCRAISRFLSRFFRILHGRDIIVYDWLLPHNYLEIINNYLEQPIKQVCIYRDPRDRFLSALKSGCFLPTDPDSYCTDYQELLHSTPPYEHRLILRFEDLVLHYAETTRLMMDFLHLTPTHHHAPQSVFDPQLSRTNIGIWRTYADPTFMHEIAQRTQDLCYTPTPMSSTPENPALV